MTIEEARNRSEAETLVNIISQGEDTFKKLNKKDRIFLHNVIMQLEFPLNTFTLPQIFWLRDIKDKCL